MRRALSGLFLPLRLLAPIQTRNIHGSRIIRRDYTDDEGDDEKLTKDRLIHSLGFESDNMDNLLHDITTGEKPIESSRQREHGRKQMSRVAEICMKEEMFSQVLKQLAAAHKGVVVEVPGGGERDVPAISEEDDTLHELINRLGLQVEKHTRIEKVDDLPEVRVQHAVLTLLGRALQQSLNGFRRECNKRFKARSAGKESEDVGHLLAWRCKVLKAYAECFASLTEVHHHFSNTVGDKNTGDNENASDVCTECLSSAAIISSGLSATVELRWHLSNCLKVAGAEDETLTSLDHSIMSCSSRLLTDASALLEETVSKGVRGTGGSAQPSLLHSVLLLAERTLGTLETTRGAACKDLSGSVNAFYSMMLCVLFSFTSFPPGATFQLESRCITTLRQLWAKIAPPLERRTSDSLMTHRTVHSTLNLRYLRCREGLHADNKFLQFLSSKPDSAFLVLELLNRVAAVWATRNEARDYDLIPAVNSSAVLCRTLLEMEIELYFLACSKTAKNWIVLVDPSTKKEGATQAQPPSESAWERVLVAASTVRVGVSSLIELYVRSYVSQDLQGPPPSNPRTKMAFTKHPACCFLKNISASFFPLLRRHYLDTLGSEVLVSCLQVFLLLKQLSDVMESGGGGDDRQSGQVAEALRVCGVPLSQAAEVAFFMSFLQYGCHVRPVSSSGISADSVVSPTIVSMYVREVLFALDYNTAKQLRHLRAKKVLHCFTGLRCDNGEKVDGRLLRRQAQSVLSVVHAHVMHPSFLWMPLHQLQEIFFILSHERQLTKGLRNTKGALGDEASETPSLFSVGSHGAKPRHFSRALGYLSLRLYVVTNVLRHYRIFLLRGDRRKGVGMPLNDSAVEERKRMRRQWSRDMAHLLHSKCSNLLAEVEGLNPANSTDQEKANWRALARLEATINLAVRNSLIYSVKKRKRMAALDAARERGEAEASVEAGDNTSPEDIGAEPSDGEGTADHKAPAERVFHLTLMRNDAEAPLGFSLHGSRSTIRRIVFKNDGVMGGASVAGNNTPFSAALREIGILDPHSVVGWRITQIDGTDVEDTSAIIPLIRGKRKFSMTLRPGDDNKS
ncbi:hypothetical protein, conserved [Trypanosoma brucei brucei TREU927]|uniref:Uncharacterized protein n=1 Tax=Trypanosoma brucei brucei (strain 927/4 GUTat10.1) TaxID=185431 RepID=Q381S8_TRYB2|nr:hypothetical protein, conserved [Trypanosoma brucei brucei TREU927]EAN80453.1 hypothetical protein, conserved [Trypanosoma brucei brucei TREU927]